MRNEPYAEVRQIGRWRYSIRIVDGIVVIEPDTGWRRYGYKRAKHKAQVELSRYLTRETWRNSHVVRAGE